MNRKAVVAIMVSIFGFASGPLSLQTAAASQPPIDQSALVIILIGTFLGTIFVLGIQSGRKNPKPFTFGWYLFAAGAIYFIATGLSAAITSAVVGSVGPHSFLFLVIGAGLLLGVLACRKLFSSKFAAST